MNFSRKKILEKIFQVTYLTPNPILPGVPPWDDTVKSALKCDFFFLIVNKLLISCNYLIFK